MTSDLDEILADVPMSDDMRWVLRNILLDREDAIADAIREWASQLGAYPELTAEVLCMVGLGRPVDTATRAHIHSRYHWRIRQIQQGNI